MKFMFMIYHDEDELDALPAGEMQTLVDSALDYDDEIRRSGHYIVSNALQSARTARTIRVRSGKVSTTDGPFAETKEQIGGFFLIEAKDMDEACAVASRFPPARIGIIEVRPVQELTALLVREAVDAVYRSESRRVLATLIRLLGDFDLAEEAMHDAFAAAVEQWPREGMPANPRAWLVSTGRFKAIDAMRRRARFDASQTEIAERLEADTDALHPGTRPRTSRTTASGSSSPAATRPCRRTRRWR